MDDPLSDEEFDDFMTAIDPPQPKVLNRVETRDLDGRSGSSIVLALVKVPPGTKVLIVEDL